VGASADGRCSIVLHDTMNGSPLTIPDEVRSELLAIEAAASEYS
jgi:hypothetical protein